MESPVEEEITSYSTTDAEIDTHLGQKVKGEEMISCEIHLAKKDSSEEPKPTSINNNIKESSDAQHYSGVLLESASKDLKAIIFPEDSQVELIGDEERASTSANIQRMMSGVAMEARENCDETSTLFSADEKSCEGEREITSELELETASPYASPSEMCFDSESEDKEFDGESSVKEYSCNVCVVSFSTIDGLDQHFNECHKEDRVNSDNTEDCEDDKGMIRSKRLSDITSNGSKRKEPINPDKPKPHKCGVCEKSFTATDHLKYHMRIHTGERPFKCDVCEKTFIQAGGLRAHMRIHTKERPFICKVCGMTFNQRGNLYSHMGVHVEDKTKFQCPTCGKCFSQGGSLRNHIKIHTGEKPHKCSVCEKAFLRKNHLDTHMRTHTGEKPYICSICDRGFSQTGDLQSHMRLHTGELNHVCKECGKGFTASGHLKKHMRIHTGEKPYACTICDKAFNASSTLATHVRMHNGDKPYVCSLCGRGFYGSSNLRKHMRIHTGELLPPPGPTRMKRPILPIPPSS